MGDEVKTVKLMRSPIDTTCGGCGELLPFGAWVYYNPQTTEAICPECGVTRGWTSKTRVKQIIKAYELREDIKSLRALRKIELGALMLLKQQIDLHRLGERDLELEQQIVKMMDTVRDYFKHCGTPKEKEALNKVFEVIRETQEVQREVREHLQGSLFLIKKKEKKMEKKRKSMQSLAVNKD